MIKNRKLILSVLALIIVLINTTIYFSIRGYIKNNFHAQNKVAIHDVLNDFQEMEYFIDNINTNALLFTSKFIEANPDIDNDDLTKLKNLLEVSNIVVLNDKGKIELATYEPKMSQNFYDHFSLLSYKVCPEYSKMQVPNDFFAFKTERKSIPFIYNKDRGMSGKYSIAWNDKVKKYIQVCYEQKELETFLTKKEARPYLNLKYFAVSTPNGYKILDYSKMPNFVPDLERIDVYPESQDDVSTKTHEERDMIYLTIPFGGLKSENCIQKNTELVSKSGEYFYVATFVFSKSEMQKQLKITNILFFIFTALITGMFVSTFCLFDSNYELKHGSEKNKDSMDIDL